MTATVVAPSVVRRTASLAGLSVLALALGFAQTAIVLVRFGAGPATDAFFAAYAVPQFALAVVSVAAVSAAVPMLVPMQGRRHREAAWALVLGTAIAFTVLAVVLAVLAPAIAHVLAPGFDADVVAVVATSIRIQVIAMVLNAAGTMAAAAVQSNGEYRRSAVATIGGAVFGVFAVVTLVPHLGIHAAAWAEVARYGGTLTLVALALGRPAIGTAWAATVAACWRRMRPLVLAGTYYRGDVVVDRVVASLAPAGGLSMLALVQRLYGASAQVVQNAVAVPALSEMSATTGDERFDRRRAALRHGAALAVGLWVLTAVAIVVARPFVAGLGHLDDADARGIAVVAVLLGGVLVGSVVGQVLSSAHYAAGDTRTPAVVGAVGFTIGTAVKVVAVVVAGIPGLAVAMSAQYAGTCWLSHRVLGRQPS